MIAKEKEFHSKFQIVEMLRSEAIVSRVVANGLATIFLSFFLFFRPGITFSSRDETAAHKLVQNAARFPKEQ